jgi:hypothetical protein
MMQKEITCQICGNTFIRTSSASKFCKPCSIKKRKDDLIISGLKRRNRRRLEKPKVSCKMCGSLFVRSMYNVGYCASCSSEETKKERKRDKNSRYYTNNKEKCMGWSTAWRRNNKERVIEKCKERKAKIDCCQHLRRVFKTSKATDEQKVLAAFINIGKRITLNRIDKSTINERIYRIQQGDVYAAYE